jgi:pimeloyl-ACP methyl ester carboxylesterase
MAIMVRALVWLLAFTYTNKNTPIHPKYGTRISLRGATTTMMYTPGINTDIFDTTPNPNPLLVLGGLGASRLVDIKGATIWPPTMCNVLADTDQWRARVLSPAGVHTLAFGDPDAFDLYPLFPFLVRTNYLDAIPRPEIACTVPYDFRQIHDVEYLETFNTKLQAYIESQDRPVVMLAHSTGGIVAHWFMHTRPKEWVKRYIKAAVYVGVPFAGLALTMAELLRPSPMSRAVGIDVLSRIGGFALNLPDVSVLTCIDPPPVFKITQVKEQEGQKPVYAPAPVPKFGSNSVPLEVARSMYKDAYAIRTALAIPPVVPWTVLHGAGKLTIVGLSERAERIYGVGDGVVPAASLAPPPAWRIHGTGTIMPVHGASHTGVLFSPELRHILRNLES